MIKFIDDKNVEHNSLNSIVCDGTTLHLDEEDLRKLVNEMWELRPDILNNLPSTIALTDRIEELSDALEELESDYYDLKDTLDEYESLLQENDIDY